MYKKISRLLKKGLSIYYRLRIKNHPCIISRDCIGGVLYERLDTVFTSPTIKLYMTNEDFILFCLYLQDFVLGKIEEIIEPVGYPVGRIRTDKGEIKLHFMHYSSFEEAAISWEARKQRIDYNNIRVILNAEPKVEHGVVNNFMKIPYKKILLSSDLEECSELKNMKCYQKGYVGPLVAYTSKKIPFLRYMDEIDWIDFLN